MHVKSFILTLCCLSILLGWIPVPAGNLTLIEKRITELDQLNKHIVRNTLILPANGIYNIRAQVRNRSASPIFKLISKQFSETRKGIFPFKHDNQVL